MQNFSEFILNETHQEITEALGGLANVPKQWLAAVTKSYGHRAGEGSTVEVIGTGAGVRSEGGLRNVIKGGIAKVHKGEYEFVWVELDATPILGFAGANGYGSDQVKIFTDSGALVTATRSVQNAWTGKYRGSGKNREYVPASYSKVTDRAFKVSDASDKALNAVLAVLLPDGGEIEAINWKSVNLTVKALTADENRRLKSNDRKELTAKPKNKLSPEATTALKRAVQSKIDLMMRDVLKALPTGDTVFAALDSAAEGKYNSKTQSLKVSIPDTVVQTLKDVNNMIADLDSIVRNGGKGYAGWDEGAQASYSLKDLMAKLKM